MSTAWLTAQYVAEQVRRRLSGVFKVNSERGALTLEWIVIAGVIAAAAVAAGLFFGKEISKYMAKLP